MFILLSILCILSFSFNLSAMENAYDLLDPEIIAFQDELHQAAIENDESRFKELITPCFQSKEKNIKHRQETNRRLKIMQRAALFDEKNNNESLTLLDDDTNIKNLMDAYKFIIDTNDDEFMKTIKSSIESVNESTISTASCEHPFFQYSFIHYIDNPTTNEKISLIDLTFQMGKFAATQCLLQWTSGKALLYAQCDETTHCYQYLRNVDTSLIKSICNYAKQLKKPDVESNLYKTLLCINYYGNSAEDLKVFDVIKKNGFNINQLLYNELPLQIVINEHWCKSIMLFRVINYLVTNNTQEINFFNEIKIHSQITTSNNTLLHGIILKMLSLANLNSHESKDYVKSFKNIISCIIKKNSQIVERANSNGETPLSLMTTLKGAYQKKNNSAVVVTACDQIIGQMIIENRNHWGNANGNNAVHIAAQNLSITALQSLKDKTDDDGNTPLFLYINNENKTPVHILLETAIKNMTFVASNEALKNLIQEMVQKLEAALQDEISSAEESENALFAEHKSIYDPDKTFPKLKERYTKALTDHCAANNKKQKDSKDSVNNKKSQNPSFFMRHPIACTLGGISFMVITAWMYTYFFK